MNIKLACALVSAASLALVACGGGDKPVIDLGEPDAAVDTGPACDPIAQDCGDGEKCGPLVESEEPPSATEACVPDGTVEAGGACANLVGEPAAGEGYDDCAAGLDCIDGTCVEICEDGEMSDTCSSGDRVCVPVFDYFTESVGRCNATCSPQVAETSCESSGESATSCYWSLSDRDGLCLNVSEEATSITQDMECQGTGAGYFINGCAVGHGCLQYSDPQGTFECAFFCAKEGEGKSCADGPGAEGYECRYLNSWLGYMEPVVPKEIGICVPTAEFQSCADGSTTRGCTHVATGTARRPDPRAALRRLQSTL